MLLILTRILCGPKIHPSSSQHDCFPFGTPWLPMRVWWNKHFFILLQYKGINPTSPMVITSVTSDSDVDKMVLHHEDNLERLCLATLTLYACVSVTVGVSTHVKNHFLEDHNGKWSKWSFTLLHLLLPWQIFICQQNICQQLCYKQGFPAGDTEAPRRTSPISQLLHTAWKTCVWHRDSWRYVTDVLPTWCETLSLSVQR